MTMLKAARRDCRREFRAFRLQFPISAVFEMVFEEQRAKFAKKQPRFEVIALRGEAEELAYPAHDFSHQAAW